MVITAVRIVSRQSKLALQQAEIVKKQLLQFNPQLPIEILGITTAGDQILDQPLNKIGGKGLFVNELEQYLLQHKADIAVHSMKDMPSALANGLAIGAVLKRADPRDVFISKKYADLKDVPAGGIIGTSSLRRQAQVLMLRHDLSIKPLRGNVETRIQKLLNAEYDGIILAAAGLERLGLSEWLQHPFATEHILPAVGQGALAVEYLAANSQIKALLAPLNDKTTAACVHAERAMNAVLDGGCQAPIAGLATIEGDQLTLHGLVADINGLFSITDMQTGHKDNAAIIGKQVAQQLISAGASEIIQKLKSQWQNNAW